MASRLWGAQRVAICCIIITIITVRTEDQYLSAVCNRWGDWRLNPSTGEKLSTGFSDRGKANKEAGEGQRLNKVTDEKAKTEWSNRWKQRLNQVTCGDKDWIK